MPFTILKNIFCTICVGLSLLSTFNCVAQSNKSEFNAAYKQYNEYVLQENYTAALAYAKKSYDLSKELFDDTHPYRLACTDNYAVNLMVLDKNVEAKAVFTELLSLYEIKYGKHAEELQPILDDLVATSKSIDALKNSEELKALDIRRYKLYLRHNSSDFIQKFKQGTLETTQHSKNLQSTVSRFLDRDFELYESPHWSIVYHKSQKKMVKKIAAAMEKTYESNLSFLVAFNLRNKPIKEKMTAVYFPSREDYIAYVTQFGDSFAAKNSGGIYSSKSRAIFFFDYGPQKNGKTKTVHPNTVIHEATHQVMYAFGLHSIYYMQPRWLKEGIAVSFERHSMKNEFGPHTNNYSFHRVGIIEREYENNNLISLSELVTFDGDDEEFDNTMNTSSIYALGGMAVRFLYKNYPDEFKEYLTILSKSRSTRYERFKTGKNIRFKQFNKAFGDPKLLDESFEKYVLNLLEESNVLKAAFIKERKNNKAKKKQQNQAEKAAIDKFLAS